MSTVYLSFQNITRRVGIQLANGVFELPVQISGGVNLDMLSMGADYINVDPQFGYGSSAASAFNFTLQVSVAPKGGRPTVTADFEGIIFLGTDQGAPSELVPGQPMEIPGYDG